MEISFLTTVAGSIEDTIRHQVQQSIHMDWAVAFGTTAAFDIFRADFEDFFSRGGAMRSVFDLTAGVTAPSLIEELATYPAESKCRVFVGSDSNTCLFHHKLYYFESVKRAAALIGSANFTHGALRNNHESSIVLTDGRSNAKLKSIKEFFETGVWNLKGVVNPLLDPEILELYKEYYLKRRRSQNRLKGSLAKLRQRVSDVYDSTVDFSKINVGVANLLGMIGANRHSEKNVRQRLIRLRFQSQVMKPGTPLEGYISAPINGALLGGIKLKQKETQVKAMRRIFDELTTMLHADSTLNQTAFSDRSAKTTNVVIDIRFAENSQIWKQVLKYVKDSSASGEFVPIIPKSIRGDEALMRAFLRGYFDFRARISTSDAMPNRKLRLAVQIDTKALDFANDMEQALFDYGDQISISDGSARGRDNMIRFYPTKQSLELFDKGWKRSLVNQFIRFNDDL